MSWREFDGHRADRGIRSLTGGLAEAGMTLQSIPDSNIVWETGDKAYGIVVRWKSPFGHQLYGAMHFDQLFI